MLKNLNWSNFENGKLGVKCDSNIKADNFLKECKERGYTIKEYNWLDNEEDTVFYCVSKCLLIEYDSIYNLFNLNEIINI